MKTKIVDFNTDYPAFEEIPACGKIIREGGLVIFPTDTVYGIAANNNDPNAIKRLKEVKRRADNKPFTILVKQLSDIFEHTNSSNVSLYKLIDSFWPGPLTVVVPSRKPGETVGLRMPNDIIALRLIQESQCPIVAPSANIAGAPEPRTCLEALKDLDGLVDVAIDGGESKIGKSSTVVSFLKDEPEILREGVVSKEDIDNVVSRKTVMFVCTGNSCRSFMAEYVMRDMLGDNSNIDVLSTGTSVFLNTSASPNAVSVLKEEGIDGSRHISRQVSKLLVKKSDYVFAMTQSHRAQILSVVPEMKDKVLLFKQAVNAASSYPEDADVPDPMGMAYGEYKKCLDTIKRSVKKIIEMINS